MGKGESQKTCCLPSKPLWVHQTAARPDTYSDAARNEDLGKCRNLISPSAPATDFITKVAQLGWKDIQTVIKAARNNSVPGPNDIPNLVYKRCPKLLEHSGVVTQLIREGREGGEVGCTMARPSQCVWLHTAQASGDTGEAPCPRQHQSPHYYNNFNLRFKSGTVTPELHRLEKGIITGCTISVMLFPLAMSMLVKSAAPECRGPKTKSGICQPLIREIMDVQIVRTQVPGC